MNREPAGGWQEMVTLWQSEAAPVTLADIEACHGRQRHRVLATTVAELIGAGLGIAAALWLVLVPQMRWVGILVASCSFISSVVMVRARRVAAPSGAVDLKESLKASVIFQDWLAEQLRYGRALSFVALFAIVMAASVQLLHLRSASTPALLATAVAGAAVSAVLVGNLVLTWQVRRRVAQLKSFAEELEA